MTQSSPSVAVLLEAKCDTTGWTTVGLLIRRALMGTLEEFGGGWKGEAVGSWCTRRRHGVASGIPLPDRFHRTYTLRESAVEGCGIVSATHLELLGLLKILQNSN
jgi:hypothetical protein